MVLAMGCCEVSLPSPAQPPLNAIPEALIDDPKIGTIYK